MTIQRKAKAFLENKLFHLFFLAKLFLEIERNYKIINFIKSNKLKKLSSLDIGKYKSSNTLFIMGSGASINELNDKEWQIIHKNDSIGINFWLIHEFIPTYYMFEPGVNLDRLNTFFQLLSLRSIDYSNTPILIRDVESNKLDMSRIPSHLKPNIYIPYKLAIPGNEKDSLSKAIKLINILKLHHTSNLLLTKRASISQAISFGQKMEYKNIVLCGVDLNNVEYFYEDDHYRNSNIPIPRSEQRGAIHKTVDPTYYGKITIDIVIEKMNNNLLKTNNINLYIGSKKSALYPRLPCYFS